MTIKYYKTCTLEVMSAYAEMQAATKVLTDNCKVFANKFDAVNIMKTSMTGRNFGGLYLNNYATRDDKHLWTTPNRNNISWPRANINVKTYKESLRFKSLTPEEVKQKVKQAKLDLKELESKYKKERVGMDCVDFDKFFASFGTDWANLMFGGLQWFDYGNTLYLVTKNTLPLIEILGSEYELAESKVKQQKV